MGYYNDVVVTKVFDGEVIVASGSALSGVIDLGSGSWPSRDEFFGLVNSINRDYSVLCTNYGRGVSLIY